MKRVLPPGQLPELPAKTFRMGMSKFEPNFIEARRQKLEEYLADLIAAVPPERIDALDDFLAYSEHCLLEMVEHLATIPALAHIHRMLRKAVEASRGGSGGSQAGARGAGAAADSDDDDDPPAATPRQAAAAAPPVEPAARNAELLTAMQAVVDLMRDARHAMTSTDEDVHASLEAARTRNSFLEGQLRDRRQEATDFRQYMSALRERRALECTKERTALGVATGQCRTVAAEWLRVGRYIGCHRIVSGAHAAATARYRRGELLSSWEGATALAARKAAHGQSPPGSARSSAAAATASPEQQPHPAAASVDGASLSAPALSPVAPVVPELADQAAHVEAAGAAALRIAAALDDARLHQTHHISGSDSGGGGGGGRVEGGDAAAAASAQTAALLESHASLCSGANQAAILGLVEQAAANVELARLLLILRGSSGGARAGAPPAEWTAQVEAGVAAEPPPAAVAAAAAAAAGDAGGRGSAALGVADEASSLGSPVGSPEEPHWRASQPPPSSGAASTSSAATPPVPHAVHGRAGDRGAPPPPPSAAVSGRGGLNPHFAALHVSTPPPAPAAASKPARRDSPPPPQRAQVSSVAGGDSGGRTAMAAAPPGPASLGNPFDGMPTSAMVAARGNPFDGPAAAAAAPPPSQPATALPASGRGNPFGGAAQAAGAGGGRSSRGSGVPAAAAPRVAAPRPAPTAVPPPPPPNQPRARPAVPFRGGDRG